MPTLSLTPEWIAAFVSVGWLALALLVFFAALPILFRLTREKSFTVSVAGFQLSVQNATEQIGDQLRDLQDRIRALESGSHPTEPPSQPTPLPQSQAAPPPRSAHRPRRILWVDDYPSNNAFAVEKLRKDGFEVVLCESTASGFRKFREQEFGLVISDMGREEKDGNNPTAGLDLLRLLRTADKETPVLFFTSRRAVSAHRDEVMAMGGLEITASAVEMFEQIARTFGDGPTAEGAYRDISR